MDREKAGASPGLSTRQRPLSPSSYFEDGDIIEITNIDTPLWGRGRWRVVDVSSSRVLLGPVNAEGDSDDSRRPCAILLHRGGLIQL